MEVKHFAVNDFEAFWTRVLVLDLQCNVADLLPEPFTFSNIYLVSANKYVHEFLRTFFYLTYIQREIKTKVNTCTNNVSCTITFSLVL